MKTLLVRPLFVKIDTKDSLISDRNILTFSDGKIYNPFKNEYYQLMLISIDPDKKIEVGDTGYINIGGGTNCIKKVIATQDQLSPDLINQLISEYNNGGMSDFEIELAVRSNAALGYSEYVYLEHIKNKSYLPTKIDANVNQNSYQLGKEEEFEDWEIETNIKLTNGFVTVIEKHVSNVLNDPDFESKKFIYFPFKVNEDSIVLHGAGKFGETSLVLDRDKSTLLFIELWKFLKMGKNLSTETNSDAFDRGFIAGENAVRERLEAVLYNEEEVRILCKKAITDASLESNRLNKPDYSIDFNVFGDTWFNENKKK